MGDLLLLRKRFIIKDGFNRSDTESKLGKAETGQLWQYYVGSRFAIINNAAQIISDSGDIAYIPTGVPNIRINATVGINVAGLSPVYFRIGSESWNTNWQVRIYEFAGVKKYQLNKKVDKINTVVGEYVVPSFNNVDMLSVTIKDNVITVYLNGNQIIQVTDSALSEYMNAGFGGYNALGASIDNFEVEAI